MSDALPLPEAPWIQALRPDDREILKSYGEFISAQPASPFLVEGGAQGNLYLVVSGSLAVTRHTELGEAQVATIGPGESVGEVALFDGGPASATVTATGFSQLWRINREELLAFMTDNPGAGIQLVMGLATTLAERLRKSDPLGTTGTASPTETQTE